VLLPDVNVLLYAHREHMVDHERYRAWLQEQLAGSEPFGVSEFVLSSVVRIATNPRMFERPSTIEEALVFSEQIRAAPSSVIITSGSRHWEIFERLCREADVRGDLVPDAYLAALAIESGSELMTADRDFARFPGLRWRHPLR
jgi:toxin-antitoxin system PIN domain toxin